ncbi:MAG TPA: hypothetical protein VMV14_05955 [Acidimicrobiales bacterium]|nr:hypothetical protein [Acidimicrobiales bacterium]
MWGSTKKPAHAAVGRGLRGWSKTAKVLGASLGALTAAAGAYAATNWVVGLNTGSSAQGQGATIASLTITAVSSPTPSNLLYPGGNGDVVVTISNPNPYPVTVTAVQLPTNTTYGNGYTTSALSTLQTGCVATTPSDVIWNYSTGSSGTSHTLTTPLTVSASGQANNPLTVTFTNDASMTLSSPLACASTYFSMPSLTGVTATGGAATATTSPVTDSWTS